MSQLDTARQTEAFIDHLLDSLAGAFEVYTIHIGDQLGFYETLADEGALTPRDLATHTETHERYVREWLEQQTVAGILAVENERANASERRYSLPSEYVEPLTEESSLNFLAPLAQLFVGAASPIDRVVEAFSTGKGVPFAAFGHDLHEGQGRMNRSVFSQLLGEEWLPAVPDVHERLQHESARVADIGCGYGYSAIAIAKRYPGVRVDGYDLDEASVAAANEHVAEAGLEDRVTIHHRDAGDPVIEGEYDLVTAFECVHDLSDPVGVLEAMRRLAGDDGIVVVMDERVGDSFAETGDLDWMMYGWSVLHCLPVGMADQPSAATGTVM
ncbi:MAG TPA: methyltransferase, partial [Halococcus sp.]|nr:methyltransferase [Halococcus sp.]